MTADAHDRANDDATETMFAAAWERDEAGVLCKIAYRSEGASAWTDAGVLRFSTLAFEGWLRRVLRIAYGSGTALTIHRGSIDEAKRLATKGG